MNPFPADSVVGQYFPVFLEGAVTTLAIVLAAIVCATVLGYFIALMRLSRFSMRAGRRRFVPCGTAHAITGKCS